MCATTSDLADGIVDLGPRDVIVAFDFRRYQVDVINYCRQAAARGAQIILFTDPWKSPIAEVARVTLMSPVETISPYDTMVPAAVLVEALIAALVARLTPASRARRRTIEESRRVFGVTTDAAAERRQIASPRRRRGNGGGG